MKTLVASLLVTSSLFVTPAFAQTQAQMNQQAANDAKRADAALNAVYAAVTKKLDAQSRALVLGAQRAWLGYRDGNCKYESSLYAGGSMYPLIYSGCITRMTRALTAELNGQLKDLNQR